MSHRRTGWSPLKKQAANWMEPGSCEGDCADVTRPCAIPSIGSAPERRRRSKVIPLILPWHQRQWVLQTSNSDGLARYLAEFSSWMAGGRQEDRPMPRDQVCKRYLSRHSMLGFNDPPLVGPRGLLVAAEVSDGGAGGRTIRMHPAGPRMARERHCRQKPLRRSGFWLPPRWW